MGEAMRAILGGIGGDMLTFLLWLNQLDKTVMRLEQAYGVFGVFFMVAGTFLVTVAVGAFLVDWFLFFFLGHR